VFNEIIFWEKADEINNLKWSNKRVVNDNMIYIQETSGGVFVCIHIRDLLSEISTLQYVKHQTLNSVQIYLVTA